VLKSADSETGGGGESFGGGKVVLEAWGLEKEGGFGGSAVVGMRDLRSVSSICGGE